MSVLKLILNLIIECSVNSPLRLQETSGTKELCTKSDLNGCFSFSPLHSIQTQTGVCPHIFIFIFSTSCYQPIVLPFVHVPEKCRLQVTELESDLQTVRLDKSARVTLQQIHRASALVLDFFLLRMRHE